MKRKLPLIVFILICFCSLTVLTSCDAVLDMIFGPKTPSDSSTEPASHVHRMQAKTYVGETCVGQNSITYYKCSSCGKCYLDQSGNNEIADLTDLNQGHLYVIKITETEHYFECSFCKTEQEGSRGQHSSERYWYNTAEHYKKCGVCDATFDKGGHDETGSCSVCGRQADYIAMCNGRYGYDQLAAFENGKSMQALYDKIDEAVSSAHNDASLNTTSLDVNIDLTMLLSVGDAKITVASYTHDNPLYYWLDKKSAFKYPQDDEDRNESERRCAGVILYVVEDYSDGQARAAQNKVIYNEIDSYLSAVSDEKDPYYVSLGLHDAIINNVDYATKSDGTPEDASWAHSILGVFDGKSTLSSGNFAVCEGYAKAFQLLLNACGVENVYVTGSSKNVGHAWNMIRLGNGDWYLYDLTWDDQPDYVGGKTYDYFCKTYSDFESDHTATVSNAGDGVNYLYVLPKAADEEYQTEGLELNESFTQQCFTYSLIGYESLSVDKCLYVGDDGVSVIPSAVEQGGRTYNVTQIGGEAFATYVYAADKKTVLSISSPSVIRLVIPKTVNLIYNKSIYDCKTISSVEFADCEGWRRCTLTGQRPTYENISSADLSNSAKASALFKELNRYVWIKNG